MSKKTIGIGLTVIGILVIAGALLADLIGLGKNTNMIGVQQLIGAGIGLILALVGVFLSLQRKK